MSCRIDPSRPVLTIAAAMFLALALTSSLSAPPASGAECPSVLDLTGNWHEQDSLTDRLQIHEPDLQDNDRRTFQQRLILPAGQYAFELEYDGAHDRTPGRALQGERDTFDGFAIDGHARRLAMRPEGSGPLRRARTSLTLREARAVDLSLTLCATRPLRTRLYAASALPASSRFRAVI